jgi:AAA+ ATPase superfamily predicted ATPase
MRIVGRNKEIDILNENLASNKPEFVALYGRRRVGKTYLIRNVFEDKFSS